MKMALSYDLTAADWYGIRYEKFNDCCALSGVNNISLDHFIALKTGHGGTVIGNVYPLCRLLNSSKGDMNPFEWVKRNGVRERIDIKRFNTLVEYLAEQNGLTVDEFRDFVYWAYENPRSLEEVQRDHRVNSIELWRQ
ncbi:hypothetical protein [Melghirimyces algeriensis]|nr:hypothetical protein [Melghirimyces algeriensis]